MRLINADTAKEYARNHLSNPYEIMSTCAMIDSTDTEDAKMVIHGTWIMDSNPDDGDCRCSNCHICIDALHKRNHEILKLLGYRLNTFYKYCPNCGATMDL